MNKISRYIYIISFAMLFVIGSASAQAASNTTHSLTVLPRPNTTVQNDTHQLQTPPPPQANASSNYTGNQTQIQPKNISSTQAASATPNSNPITDFFSGIASFFSKLFS